MNTQLPSLDLLRSLSDRHVLSTIAAGAPLTRAAIAASTGLSKPTVSQSVARLINAGVIESAGKASGGRGRSGVNVCVRAAAGCAAVVHAAPQGVIGQVATLDGQVPATVRRALPVPVPSVILGEALQEVCAGLRAAAPGPIRVVTMSLADPVQRRTGYAVELPESPFLIGELDPVELLADLLPVPPEVDNDVNWALIAERQFGVARAASDVVYLYLDQGMGSAVLVDGLLAHGSRGLAGEIAYSPSFVTDPAGSGTVGGSLIECLRRLGYVQPSKAVLTERLTADLDAATGPALAAAAAVAHVAGGLAYLLDPALIVLAGSWGTHPALVASVRDTVHQRAGHGAQVAPAGVTEQASLAGARFVAVQRLLDSWVPGTGSTGDRDSGGQPDVLSTGSAPARTTR